MIEMAKFRGPRWAAPTLLVAMLWSAASLGAATVAGNPAPAQPDEVPVEEVGEELVVTATRSDRPRLEVPASVTAVEMEALDDRGFFVAADELRGQPGVFFRRGEGDNDDFLFVNIRGVTGNHGNDTFLALLDGVPFVGADEEVYMTDIPYAAVSSVEIVRGPVSALYGRGAIGGAINYLTRPLANPGVGFELAAGSDGLRRGEVSANVGGAVARGLVSATWEESEGWRARNERRFGQGFLKGSIALTAASSVTGWTSYLDKSYQVGSPLPTLADGTVLAVAGGRSGSLGTASIGRDPGADRLSWTSMARWQQQLGSSAVIEATLSHRRGDDENRYDFYDAFAFDPSRNVMGFNGFASESEERTTFAGLNLAWSGGDTQLLAGLDGERTTLDERDYWTGQYGFTFECGFAFYLIEVDYTSGRVTNTDHPCFVRDQERARFAGRTRFGSAWAQVEHRFGDRLTVTLGGRYDSFSRRTDQQTGVPLEIRPRASDAEDQLAPKLAVSYRVASGHLLYASYGEGFSSNFGPYWQWDPSQYVRDTRPTKVVNVEVGAKGRRGVFDYALALFQLEQRDRLIFISNPEAETDFTAPATLITTGQLYRARGAELALRAASESGWRGELSASLVDAEWRELVIDSFGGPIDLSGRRPTGVPETMVSAAVERRVAGNWSARLAWEWYDDYAITQDNRYQGGGYDLVNLALVWEPHRLGIERLTLAATNLLDEEYDYFFGDRTAVLTAVPGVPRQLRLTARLGWPGGR